MRSDEVSSGKPDPTLFFQVYAIAGFLSAKALTFEASDIGIEAAHVVKRINFSGTAISINFPELFRLRIHRSAKSIENGLAI